MLDKLLSCADNFYSELKKRKAAPIGPAKKPTTSVGDISWGDTGIGHTLEKERSVC